MHILCKINVIKQQMQIYGTSHLFLSIFVINFATQKRWSRSLSGFVARMVEW